MGQPATGSLYLTAKQQALVMVIILPSISSSKSEVRDSGCPQPQSPAITHTRALA